MNLLYHVWSPHLWFSLITLVMSYPQNPTDIIKKQYYTYINNLPLFYPYDNFDKNFEILLKTYPVTPYLDTNLDLLKWVNFIQNKTDEMYKIKTKTLNDTILDYYKHYETIDEEKKYISLKTYFSVCILLVIAIIYFKNNKYTSNI